MVSKNPAVGGVNNVKVTTNVMVPVWVPGQF